jgi:diguanylate cyclase (GGDEF)-like protein
VGGVDAAIGAARLTMPRRLRLLFAAVAVAAGCCLAVVATGMSAPGDAWWAIPLVVLLTAATRFAAVRLQLGSSAVSADWGEAVLIVAFVLLDPPWVVLAVGAGVAVGFFVLRLDPVKLAFNVAVHVVAASVASIALIAVSGPRPNPFGAAGTTGAIALAVVAVVSVLTSEIACGAAVAFSRATPVRAVVLDGVWVKLLGLGVNLGVGFGVLAVAHYNTLVLFVLPPVLWLLFEGFAGRARAAVERRTWRRLAATTKGLNQLDPHAAIRSAVKDTAALFDADTVEIEWRDPAGRRILTRGNAGGSLWEGNPGIFRPEPSVHTEPLGDGTDGVEPGELRLCFRSNVRLYQREQLALRTLAEALSSALRNARIHQKMQELAERNAYAASHDALTLLANRARLLAEGDRAVNARAGGVALLLLDIDHFKEVNDTLGHEAGDELLCEVAGRLRDVTREGETLARLGDDEFAILVPALPDLREAADYAGARAGAMLKALRRPARIDGVALTIAASVGLVAAEVGECDMVELLRRADSAMVRAKTSGPQVAAYDPEQDAVNSDRLALTSEMRAALEADDQIVVQLQPSVELPTGVPLGAEVLVRWKHPRRGMIGPAEFIPQLEHTDLIAPLTKRILELALGTQRAWALAGLDLPVAVNVSARSLLDHTLPTDVAELLEQFGTRPERLVLEITETAMMSELGVVDEVLETLRQLGVRLSLDDFGTGYSSLTSVARVKVDEIKIDRRFVTAMDDSKQAMAVVRMTVGLAQSLDLRVIAEGVEFASQAVTLAALGCHGAQGYHFFRPMDPDVARNVLLAAAAPPDTPVVLN